MKRLLLMLPVLLAACDNAPLQPHPTLLVAAAEGGTVVTTLAEWQNAIANATSGGKILVQGTIDIPGGEEVMLVRPNVTIRAATRGSGLRGVPNASGALAYCLVCLSPTADGTTVEGLVLDGAEYVPMLATEEDTGDLLLGVRFRHNSIVCDDPCTEHVFLANAPGATFENNVLLGHSIFTSIQVQNSPGARIIGNWIEYAGRRGAIRNPDNVSPGLFVVDNTIASASAQTFSSFVGIFTRSEGSTFVNNSILELVGGLSCRDFSVGTGTAGTGNKWVANRAPVASNPVGICGPNP